jgi:hypothetical protein
MTKHAMTSADRTKIIEALKHNPNAAAVARQFDFGETTILRLCKNEGIGLQHLLTKAERTEVIELLKKNQNALATAKQLDVNHKTVLAVAKKAGIDIKGMRQAAKGRKTLPFTQWARGPGGKPVLQCAVYLNGGRRLALSLNTADTEVEGPQRMRLLLWHAIDEGQLPRGVKHPAWGLYGGPIPQASKRLLRRLAALPWGEYELERPAAQCLGYHASTIDWLTNQEEAKKADPMRRALARKLARSRARKVWKRTPISRSWQFGAVGGMLAVHSDEHPIYAQLTIAGFTLRWRLVAQSREEAQALVKPAVAARARVREAARNWRECLVGSPEAKTALAALLVEQSRFRDALLALGANRSKGWAEVAKALREPPSDETGGEKGCIRWFVHLLLENPERPPPGRPVGVLLKEAKAQFGLSDRGARRCYEFAQEKTGNWNWSTRRRPRKIPG